MASCGVFIHSEYFLHLDGTHTKKKKLCHNKLRPEELFCGFLWFFFQSKNQTLFFFTICTLRTSPKIHRDIKWNSSPSKFFPGQIQDHVTTSCTIQHVF